MAKYLDNPDDLLNRRETDEPPVTLTATEARQGRWGRPVFYVLACGLALAFIAWGAAEYFGMSIDPNATDPATTASTTRDPIANEKTIDDNQPAGQPIEKAPAIQDSNRL